jgi:hypothetical protein
MSLKLIVDDIQRAIEGGAPYAALCACLTLPEICGRCEQADIYSNKGSNRQKEIYNRFVSKYLANWSLGLTGDDLANLRCGISHRGQTAARNSQIRYIFHPPHPNGNVVHGFMSHNNGRTTLDVDLQIFCNDITSAVLKWECDNRRNEIVQRNLKDVLQVRETTFGSAVRVHGMIYLG